MYMWFISRITKIKQLLFFCWWTKMSSVHPIQCEICLTNLSTKEALNSHIQYVHEGKIRVKKSRYPEKLYKCDTCESTFSRKAHLEQHVEGVHQNMKPYQCNICNGTFLYWKLDWKHISYLFMKEWNLSSVKLGTLCFTEKYLE